MTQQPWHLYISRVIDEATVECYISGNSVVMLLEYHQWAK